MATWTRNYKQISKYIPSIYIIGSTRTHLAVGHDNVHNALLYEVHFCTDRALLYDNITCRYPKISLNSTQMKIWCSPGWKTSYFSLVTTSETKFESALAKKGTDATRDLWIESYMRYIREDMEKRKTKHSSSNFWDFWFILLVAKLVSPMIILQ